MDGPNVVSEFKYRRMAGEEREKLLEGLRRVLESVDGVLFAYVYGSFVERDLFRDVDVAVWIKKPEETLRYEVDLSSRLEADFKIPIDVRVLNEAPLPFKYIVFSRGILLFSRDEEVRVNVIDETIRQYADLRILRSIA
ncbi:MAG: nucleotidyltransferase domain-containing protein [Candidatus Bathyarchaeia archaeon]